MASAQLLPSSRKQEHLEAGKRRLEEFRKKKAAERAKKAASTTESHASDLSLNDKNQSESEPVRASISDGAGTNPSSLKIINNKTTEVSHEHQQVYSNNTLAIPSLLASDYNSSITDKHIHEKSQENEKYVAPWNGGPFFNGSLNTKHFSNDAVEPKSREDNGSLKVSAVVIPISSEDYAAKVSPQNSLQKKASEESFLSSNHVPSSFYEDSTQSTSSTRGSVFEVRQNLVSHAELRGPMISYIGDRNFNTSSSDFPSVHGPPKQTSGSSEFSFDARGFSSHMPVHSVSDDSISRRSRPSFIDSLNVSKASSGSLFQHDEPTKNPFVSHSSQFNDVDDIGSSLFKKPSTEIKTTETFSKPGFPVFPSEREHSGQFSVPVNNGALLTLNVANENISEKNHEFYSSKQNEDFAALEQYIEDLTREKFSLQRSLEASSTLAESLSAENSSLTDSYNQQRSVVNQLKSDMEKLQEEIKAQLIVQYVLCLQWFSLVAKEWCIGCSLAELESFKMEYTNARLECNAADERANILASEVIGLEEKALRLRSNELKLERQLENTEAEISSFKKKMSSLEKERQGFLSTIEALKEEKKVLQSKLRKASATGESGDIVKNPACKRDMSTSTEDLASTDPSTSDNREMSNSDNASSLSLLPDNEQLEASVYIPPDQMRMIQNINSLISELTLEKELTQALSSELSQNSKLKELNTELSRKLEAQTQRLELLTARSMAREHVPARQPESHIMHDNTPYADEGDEVVERVLGWIMKLFPGGPSRRRTNKHLSY
ncbi:hypothetical protein V6N13_027986 [Hibiscus sabdariffa]